MVLHVVIDGLRPDAIHASSAPFLNKLMEEGRSTRQAQTVMPSVTLPCHNSMFRSVPPERHGISSETLQGVSIMDAAPTLAAMAGIEPFEDWEGTTRI